MGGRRIIPAGDQPKAMQDTPLKGPIADVFLPRLIARLHRDSFEGLLRVTLHDATKIIYFRRGDVASAASNAEPDRLANVLIRDGRLTPAQLDLARSRIQEGGSVGKTLIEMGFLTPSELLEGARHQVREILASCFTLSGGSYQVEPGPPPPEVTSLGLPTKRLIFDCLAQIADRRSIVLEMGSMESVYRALESLDAGLAALKLDSEMERVGRMLNGALTLREISGRTSLDDFGVSKLVLALEILGLVERVGPPVTRAKARGGRTIVLDPLAGQSEPEPAIPGSLPVGPAGAEPVRAVGDPDEATDATRGAHGGPLDARHGAFRAAPEETAPAAAGTPAGPPPFETTPAEKAAAQAPPIPDEELPAFALPAVEAQWQIDPETGERVHLGPIEVTFDGAIPAGGRDRPILPRLLATAAIVTAVLAGSIGYLISRRGGRAPDAAGVSRPAPAPRPAESRREEADQAGGANRPAVRPKVARVAPPAPLTPSPRPTGPPAAGPAKVAPEPERVPPAPAPAQPPEPGPGFVPGVPAAPFRDGSGYQAALRQLEAGDPGGSARAFRALLASEDPGRFTLQVMIACQEETLKGARARSGDGGAFFFLPYSLKGRDCFRACWGLYPTREAAEKAIPALPDVFRGTGSKPLVLSLASLRPAD
jgi:septal ring-binding cell division protein DamX